MSSIIRWAAIAAGVVSLSGFVASNAQAAVSVFGDDHAQACYQAAKNGLNRQTDLDECNQAIGEALERINSHVMRRLGQSRRDLFLEVEQPALRPLPPTPYEYADWKRARVDYHVELLGFFTTPCHTA